VPGRIDQATSQGCHQLIRDGATLLTSVDDILSELNYLDGLRPQPIPQKNGGETLSFSPASLTEVETSVLEQFRGGAMLTLDALTTQTGRPTAELSATLMMLELKHLIAKRADGTFEARGA
jgi:DNA processing protein